MDGETAKTLIKATREEAVRRKKHSAAILLWRSCLLLFCRWHWNYFLQTNSRCNLTDWANRSADSALLTPYGCYVSWVYQHQHGRLARLGYNPMFDWTVGAQSPTLLADAISPSEAPAATLLPVAARSSTVIERRKGGRRIKHSKKIGHKMLKCMNEFYLRICLL